MMSFPGSPRPGGSPFGSQVPVDVPPFGRCSPRDAWEAWFLAQADVERAYRAWSDAPARERRVHYLGYRAALEREQCAAVVLSATFAGLDLAA